MSQIKYGNQEAPEHLDVHFWDERWKTKDTGWDLKTVSPPLKEYFDAFVFKDKSILIPGCGSAYEAEYLLQNGYKDITVIDISPTLVQQLLTKFSKYAGKELTVICGDFFKHTGTYDFIIEQTFFCALEIHRREEYVAKMQTLLKEQGKLAGLLFNKEFENSPPFGGNKEEYQQLFSSSFEIVQMEPCTTSIGPRLGAELFFELKNKATFS
ncbi:MAG TPA: methyltransferase domain-containing protein [Chitinophagales bacterium]|nr:methyltransferase domain-containing protein [Chitinophagales bacterium]